MKIYIRYLILILIITIKISFTTDLILDEVESTSIPYGMPLKSKVVNEFFIDVLKPTDGHCLIVGPLLPCVLIHIRNEENGHQLVAHKHLRNKLESLNDFKDVLNIADSNNLSLTLMTGEWRSRSKDNNEVFYLQRKGGQNRTQSQELLHIAGQLQKMFDIKRGKIKSIIVKEDPTVQTFCEDHYNDKTFLITPHGNIIKNAFPDLKKYESFLIQQGPIFYKYEPLLNNPNFSHKFVGEDYFNNISSGAQAWILQIIHHHKIKMEFEIAFNKDEVTPFSFKEYPKNIDWEDRIDGDLIFYNQVNFKRSIYQEINDESYKTIIDRLSGEFMFAMHHGWLGNEALQYCRPKKD